MQTKIRFMVLGFLNLALENFSKRTLLTSECIHPVFVIINGTVLLFFRLEAIPPSLT